MQDQAEGLRKIFIPTVDEPTVCFVACPQREAACLPLSRYLLEAFDLDRKILWIDGINLNKRENIPLHTEVRFQLSQWVKEYVEFNETVTSVGTNRWYAYSGIELPVKFPRLAHNKLCIPGDLNPGSHTTIVSSNKDLFLLNIFLHQPLHLAIICEADPLKLNMILSWISYIESNTQIASLSFIACGTNEDCEHFWRLINEDSHKYISSVPELLGKMELNLLSSPIPALKNSVRPLAELLALRMVRR